MKQKLVFATHNPNKIKEIQELVPPQIELLSLKDINCIEEIEEIGTTLEENAKIKVDYIKNKYGFDCFADDSGLEVDALDGAPGVYSARYAG
ncbi:MAG: non-canonical purine NTP pyrophosphatase, partial [Flavobacteriaceae bacterium]|nr:non-canonical purine NTP pyrophosphatase [Flavobacteriaceae bacterium]